MARSFHRGESPAASRERRAATCLYASEPGYAAIDAAMAMFIFAAMLVFAMGSAHEARRITARAAEVREARHVITGLLEAHRKADATMAGEAAGFAWRLDVGPPVKSSAASTLCEHSVRLTSRASGKVYDAVTQEICPTGDVL